jgi:ketosteroid isomerase-like protein
MRYDPEATLSSPLEVVRELQQRFARNDLAGILALLSRDVSWTYYAPAAVPYAGSYHGHDGFRRFWENLKQIGDKHFELKRTIAEGEMVVTVAHLQATVMATGRPFEYHLVQTYRVVGDLVTEVRQYFDSSSVLDALAGR